MTRAGPGAQPSLTLQPQTTPDEPAPLMDKGLAVEIEASGSTQLQEVAVADEKKFHYPFES